MASRITTRFDLPAQMNRDIGRIIVRYAYVEQYLQNIIYMLVGIERGLGKIVVREPRATDRIEMILDVIAARKMAVPKIDFKQLREALDDVADIRHSCAHGVWAWSEINNAWSVIVERGSWEGVPKTDRARRSKRLHPEGQIIKPEVLHGYVTGLDAIARKLKELQANLVA